MVGTFHKLGSFGRFLRQSVREPNNFPIYLTFAATAFLAAFAYYAWVEATRGTTAIRGQLEEMQRANRAWVAPRAAIVLGRPDDGQPINFALSFDNFGREPGNRVMLSVIMDDIPAPPSRDFSGIPVLKENICTDHPPTIDVGVSYPNATNSAIGGIFRTDSEIAGESIHRITMNDDIRQGNRFMRARGCLTYRTTNQLHYTAYCWIFIPGQNLGLVCPGWQDAD